MTTELDKKLLASTIRHRMQQHLKSGSWMQFMEAIEQHLPLLGNAGRPSKSEVESSLIGQWGFSSWTAALETPVEKGGFGLSVSAWRQHVNAWALVKTHPYLRELQISPSMLMRHKAAFTPFPDSAEALQAAIGRAKADSTVATPTDAESVAELQLRIAQLEKDLAVANGQREQLEKDHNALLASLATEKPKGFWKKLSYAFSSDKKPT